MQLVLERETREFAREPPLAPYQSQPDRALLTAPAGDNTHKRQSKTLRRNLLRLRIRNAFQIQIKE